MYKEFYKKYKKEITIGALILLLIFAGWCFYQKYHAVPMATIKDTTPASVAEGQIEAGVFKSTEDAKAVSDAIVKRVKAAPADVEFATNTQKEADKKSKEIAKADGADYVLKETTTETVPANKETGQKETTQINNKYYGVHTEKNHRVMAGVTSIDGTVHFTVGAQAEKVTVLVHSKDLKTIDGASVLYTVKEW